MRIKSATLNPGSIPGLLTIILYSMVLSQCPIQAQDLATKSYRDRVCDFAVLTDGRRLTGIAVSESPARLILRTEHLRTEAPDLFTSEIQPALIKQRGDQYKELITILRQRTEKLRIDTPDDLQQIGLLEEVIEHLGPDDQRIAPLIIVQVDQKRLKRLETLAPNRRELAMLALLNQIEDFENLHWKTITKRLQAIPAAQWKRPTPVLQSTPPAVMAEQILAAVDVRLNKATRLIRTGNEFIAEDARPELATLLSSLLSSSLNNTLQELLNETGGITDKPSSANNQQNTALPEAAARLAEKDGHATIIVSSFDFDIAHGAASVTQQLFRSSTQGGWKLVRSVTGSSTINEVTQEQVQTIEEDARIRQISGLLSQLSPDSNSMNTALKMGAVVQSASAKADVAFQATLQDILTAHIELNDTPPTVVLEVLPRQTSP